MDASTPVSSQEFLRSVYADPADQQAFVTHLQQRKIVSQLAAIRVSKGLTQGDVAACRGVTQSAISKLEAGRDADLTLADLEAYTQATQSEIRIIVSDRGQNLAEQIKYHALSIRQAFLKLVKLAHQDDLIAQGVANLHLEAFENINRMLSETAAKLPVSVEDGLPHVQLIRVATSLENGETCNTALQADQPGRLNKPVRSRRSSQSKLPPPKKPRVGRKGR